MVAITRKSNTFPHNIGLEKDFFVANINSQPSPQLYMRKMSKEEGWYSVKEKMQKKRKKIILPLQNILIGKIERKTGIRLPE